MPPPPQSQQGGSSSDNTYAPIWIVFLIFIGGFFLWKFAHQYIVKFVFTVNIVEAKIINLFLHNPDLTQLITSMRTINPYFVGWEELVNSSKIVGDYIRYPIVLILIVCGFFLYKSNIKNKFRKTHNMQTLKSQEQYNWPSIMPIVKENLSETDVNKGSWAMALSPIDFARKYKLLKKDDILRDNTNGIQINASIKRSDAKRIFTLQLGQYWEGFDRCPPHAAALAAVFIARLNRDKNAATTILETIDKSIISGKPNFAIATPTLKKYQNADNVLEIVNKHAYLLTVMASLLEGARSDGVVSSSEFLWLKPVDRRLWYMLNCVGRQTPFAEVGGPFGHWRAEKVMGRKSLVPMIEEAIKALDIAVKEVKLRPKELEELES